jgi:hypothetical protein
MRSEALVVVGKFVLGRSGYGWQAIFRLPRSSIGETVNLSNGETVNP